MTAANDDDLVRRDDETFDLPSKILTGELGEIQKRRTHFKIKSNDDQGDLWGLAHSGGGIRSATFALGVQQELAEADALKQFDYLSTVSGGGYIGSALTWLLSNSANSGTANTYGVEQSKYPFRTGVPTGGTAQTLLPFLRTHGEYLKPGNGITLISGIGVVLRGILINLFVWLPLMAAAFVVLLAVPEILAWLGDAVTAGWDTLTGVISYVVPSLKEYDAVHSVGVVGAVLFGLVFVVSSLFYAIFTYIRIGWFKEFKYDFRRFFEDYLGDVLAIFALFVLLASLPVVAELIEDAVGEAGGTFTYIAGVLAGMWSFFKSQSNEKSVISLDLLGPIAAFLVIYGLALIAYQIGVAVSDRADLGVGALALLVPSLLVGRFTNINLISIHRFYRDRLMETFMPDIETAMANETGAANGGNLASLSEMKDKNAHGPYHLVNANVITVDSKDSRLKNRGGDSFLLSPLYCGSWATHWRTTKSYMGDNMTLATAMAISGAAANPNTGVGGGGLTRNRIVSKVMLLLNLALGYWTPNPGSPKKVKNLRPHFFNVGVRALLRTIFTEKHPYIQLSDGGHFDNLGLYELIRREAKLIVLTDGGADPDYKFEDLQNAVRKIGADFEADIDFTHHLAKDGQTDVKNVGVSANEEAIKRLIPSLPSTYPDDVKRADTGFLAATIRYNRSGKKGLLIYLKTTLPKDLDLRILGYKSKHAKFPDQTTADQFFDENQFEAYMLLGQKIAREVLKDGLLSGWISTR